MNIADCSKRTNEREGTRVGVVLVTVGPGPWEDLLMSLIDRLLTAAVVASFCSPALARVPLPVPEPDTFALLGAGVVAAIIAWRIRRKK